MKGALGFDPREVAAVPPRSADAMPRAKAACAQTSAASAASAAGPPESGSGALPVEFLTLLASAPDLDVLDVGGVAVVRARLADGRAVAAKHTLVAAALAGIPAAVRARVKERLERAEVPRGAREPLPGPLAPLT
ncbi:hypothetical protein [Elioraea sp.]|uniref:hypothetical protein n=1 Tax=Elioraea sp. TaxID=2185103 RepID=UPI003F6F12E8